MDAVKFIEERKRLCRSYEYCTNCPLKGTPCGGYMNIINADAGQMVGVVEEWSAAHPRKTRQSVFLEQWPNAHKDRDGVVYFDPCLFDEAIRTDECEHKNCYKCRQEFWMRAVE